MAFQDISSPARILMRELALTREALGKIGGFFSAIGAAIMEASLMRHRIDVVAQLREKSDAELARLGIKRDDIVQHVFMDVYYT